MKGSQGEYADLSSKESLMKRYKIVWRVLLISNFALGAYMFASARNKNTSFRSHKSAKKNEKHDKDSVDVSSLPPVVLKPEEPMEWMPEDKQNLTKGPGREETN